MYCDMIVLGSLKDTVIELLLFFTCVLLFLPHWLWPSYLFLFTVSLLAIWLPCFNKLELSWRWHQNVKRTGLPEFWVDTGNAYRVGTGLADDRASIAGFSVSMLMPRRADTWVIDTRLLAHRRRTSFSKSGRRCWPTDNSKKPTTSVTKPD